MRLRTALAAALFLTTPVLAASLSDIQSEISSQLPSGSQIGAAQLRGVLNDMASYSSSIGDHRLEQYGTVTAGMDITSLVNTAATALCPSGGTLRIPAGSYVANGINIGSGACQGVHIKGAGKSATIISGTTATSNVFKFGNGTTANNFDLSLEGLTVSGFLTGGTTLPSGGILVEVSLVNSFTMRDFSIANWSTGLQLDGGSVGIKVSDGYILNGTPTTGVGVKINNALGEMNNVDITGSPGAANQPAAGIDILKTAGFWFRGISEVQSGYGLAILPTGTDAVQYVWISDSDFDSNTNGGEIIAGGASTVIGSINHSLTHFSSNGVVGSAGGANGVLISSSGVVDDVSYNGCEALNNSGNGYEFDTGSNISVIGGASYANNWGTNAFYAGIQIATASGHVTVHGSRIGTPTAGYANPPYNHLRGIFISSGAGDYIDISNNDLTGNSAAILDQSTGSHTIVTNNRGLNPIGGSAITPGASPYTYTAGHSPETVYITGGTVSAIATGGGTVATASPSSVQLWPNETVTVTYSSVPTMRKSVH
jgi:hypothetical protein